MVTLLKSAITDFAREMSRHSHGREHQTRELLSAVAQLGARAGFVVDYPGEDGSTEWLYDQTWLNFDKSGRRRLLGIELALESEWDPDRFEVMKDFNKLLQSRAKIKVMVCHDPYGGLVLAFKEAVAYYPGLESCTYLFAICDFENEEMPVVFAACDEKGQDVVQGNTKDFVARLRRLRESMAGVEQVALNFEGFWPNLRKGFIENKPGFYFVFAGVRTSTANGFAATLNRLIFIGATAEVSRLAQSQPNVFEGACNNGEIPYFAFAEMQGQGVAPEECFVALSYKFRPQINAMRDILRMPTRKIAFTMSGDIAGCLGDHSFVV